jgi:4-aminobutyrate aminotransferase-like enzyme
MLEADILLWTDGPFDTVIKIRPPMSFDDSRAGCFVADMAGF